MSMISVQNLTFHYNTNYENIFEDASFQLDTNWKTGLIARNGRGKTTLLMLLMGKYPYQGNIQSDMQFDYFPFPVNQTNRMTLPLLKDLIAPYRFWEEKMEKLLSLNTAEALEGYAALLDQYILHDGYSIDAMIEREISKLGVTSDVLCRPFSTLSFGEQTKLLLAALFLKKNHFLLIDEPTNHLDIDGKDAVAHYLASKKGFLLVSHDRDFLDQTVDHILSIGHTKIEVQRGNFTSWKRNRDQEEQFEEGEQQKLKKEIQKLSIAGKRTSGWSNQIEKSKIGEHAGDRGYIGHQAAKMMKRAKSIERRREKAIEEKKGLLQEVETIPPLKIHPLSFVKEKLVEVNRLSISYGEKEVVHDLSFQICRGDRIALKGPNGCGKSSILRLLCGETIPYTGNFATANGLVISYLPQNSNFLHGSLQTFIEESGIDESLCKAILRKLDFSRNQFEKNLEEYSLGQKKKVLLAKSLCEQAHLYIWDEPLNYIDIFSRIQIEELIQKYKPTMLFVDHDTTFLKNTASQMIHLTK